ncbi:arylamine N-acetyltransferase, pineal gland isozyme NAT-3-like [Clarias gariepinus]|uniref:arylamine N-acetyltransferase, pineal gland isozyme NAT-3-like n=1 Tax=Clarias gariepinus TaxID=13013 RepID=UPI00234D0C6D|nr:arylamine N-acetyltransferase, pineal gland isozyme NAT-3-like [Clarias gariepinus]
MDIQEYFKRIGFSGVYEKPDLATLHIIHKLHVMSIPFENLSTHCGEQNTLDLQIIYEKIVRNPRGGSCLESNLLFSWLLKEMGYKCTMLGCKVFNVFTNEKSILDEHLINLVEIDGKRYITDVSFGFLCQIWYPVEMISGKDQEQPMGIFRLLNDGETWTLEKTGRKVVFQNEAFANSRYADKKLTKSAYSFVLTPRGIDHFLNTSKYLQTSPESMFTQKYICSLQTPTGFRALTGWRYMEVTLDLEEDTEIIEIKDLADSEIETTLKEKFNIVLTNKLTPINKKDEHKK